MAPTAREVALSCLLAGERQGAWSDGYLRNAIRRAGLDRRDAAFCTRLAFGVQQNRMLLDWHIDRLSKTPLAKLEPPVRNCLRLGIYQLLLLDRVPVHAAVNESVSLAKKYSRNPRASALVNAILRTIDRTRTNLPQPSELSIRYSHPEWLVKEFSHILPPEEVERLLAADNSQPPTQIQVNTLMGTAEALAEDLAQAGVAVTPHPWLPDCLELEGTGSLEELVAFRQGRFYVQDAAARLAVEASGASLGMEVLDACAAPGGKSFAAAIRMEGRGGILSCDLHPHKKKLIEDGAKRLGIDCITASVMDARAFDPKLENRFDLVITDVPCSGLGIIRKKPDIRYKDPGPLADLPRIQRDILSNCSRYVRPGGVLLYATCTLLPRENEEVAAWFAEKEKDFTLEPFTLPGPIGRVEEGMLTLWPHRHGTDGFFMAKLRKKG